MDVILLFRFSFANVAITLRNRGIDAYKRNEYGDSIIVERRITRDGGGAYKIKNGKSKVFFCI